jgi:hypothetical protein
MGSDANVNTIISSTSNFLLVEGGHRIVLPVQVGKARTKQSYSALIVALCH